MSQGEYDYFGSGSAAFDEARGEELFHELFVETRSARQFLRSGGSPFVVGSKGAGKSLLLFKRKLAVRKASGTLVLPSNATAYSPSGGLADLVEHSRWWQLWDEKDRPIIARWAALWERALLQTVVVGWRKHARRHQLRELLERLGRIVERERMSEDDDIEEDPFTTLRVLLESIDAGTQRGLVRLPHNDHLRRFVTNNFTDFPQTYVFLDNHDDFFERGVDFWIASSIGCFVAIMNLRQETQGRVHFTMTVRPEVVWRLQEHADFPKWRHDIVHLRWDDNDLVDLLKRRITKVNPELLPSPDLVGDDPIAALLGKELRGQTGEVVLRDKVVEASPHAPFYEPAERYILRNTLGRPRDLIVMGNEILHAIQPPLPAGTSRARRIRDAVDEARAVIARGYLAEVASRWPWRDNKRTSMEQFVKEFLRRNIITHIEMLAIEEEFARRLGQAPDNGPFSILAALGLIGFVDETGEGTFQRFAHAGETTMELPRSRWYLVHPVLYGPAHTISVERGIVVGRDRRFDETALRMELLSPALEPPRVSEPSIPTPQTPRVALNRRALSWLHVSDVHFGAGNVAYRADHEQVMDAMLADVEHQIRGGVARPDYVFVTGDISFSARPEQYEQATKWLTSLAHTCGIGTERIRVVPGNHDVARDRISKVTRAAHDAIRRRPADLDEYLCGAPIDADTLRDKLANYVAFAAEFSRGVTFAPWQIDWAERLGVHGGGRVHLVGLSTVWVSDALDGRRSHEDDAFSANLVVGQNHLRELLSGARPEDLIIILTHHPPEWLSDWSRQRLLSVLASRKWLHLCGHIHSPDGSAIRQFGGFGTSLRLVAGAMHDDPNGALQHGYAWGEIRLHDGSWEVGWAPRVFDPRSNLFARMQSGLLGPNGFAYEAVALKWPSIADAASILDSQR